MLRLQLSERAGAAELVGTVGVLKPADAGRAQQRGQSPHAAVVWPPYRSTGAPACILTKDLW